MASPSNPKKRTKLVVVKNAGSDEPNESDYLERWFCGNQKSIDDYYKLYSRKIIISPKMLSLDWLKEEKLVEVRSMLKFQKLDQFLNLTRNTYPYLVKVFLTNIWYDDECVYSQVKEIDFAINEEVWMNVTRLNNDGAVVTRGNSADLGGFNKVQFYKSCLRDQSSVSRTYNVGGLATIPRILTYIVIWILTPRDINHATLTEEDLILMYCITSKIRVNWIQVICDHLFKVGKKLEYRIPYVTMLSKFIDYFEIDVEDEIVEEVKAVNQISTANLTKNGLVKLKNKKWVSKADEGTADEDNEEESTQGEFEESDDEADEANMEHDQGGMATETPIAAVGQDYFAGFEQRMFNQLNNMQDQHRVHHEYCQTHFQLIETQVDDIQSKIGTLFFPPNE